MLRIHFTAGDLMRTRVAPTLGPLAETVLAARLLQRGEDLNLFHGLRRLQPQTARHRGLLGPLFGGTHLLDLFTVTGRASSLEEGLDALQAAPRWHLRGELDTIASIRVLPTRLRALADGDRERMLELTAAIRDVHDAAIGPAWNRLRAYLDATDARHGHVLATAGVERLLGTFHPLARWRPPVLEISTPVPAADRHLQGRGLVLVPSVFCRPAPIVLHSLSDQAAPELLIFPAVGNHADLAAVWLPDDRNGRALIALLGRTRAAVLEAIADGCTTTELAGRAKTSMPSASQHAAVLRDAGLIVTRRDGKSVQHSLTPLGAALIDSNTSRSPWSLREGRTAGPTGRQ